MVGAARSSCCRAGASASTEGGWGASERMRAGGDEGTARERGEDSPLGSAGVTGGRGVPSGTASDTPAWGCSLGAVSLRGDARVMKTDEAILFSAFLGSIAETAEGLDMGWGLGGEKRRKKKKKKKLPL